MRERYIYFFICFLWLSQSLYGQAEIDYYELEVKVAFSNDQSDRFTSQGTYTNRLGPGDFTKPQRYNLTEAIDLPNSADKILLEVTLKHFVNRLDNLVLYINGLASSDKKTVLIENPFQFRAINSSLVIDLIAKESESQYRLQFMVPITWDGTLPDNGIIEEYGSYSPEVGNFSPGWSVQFGSQQMEPDIEALNRILTTEIISRGGIDP